MISLDASSYKATELESIQYYLTSPYAGEVSSYLFSFEAPIPINNKGKCYLKIMLPKELRIGTDVEF